MKTVLDRADCADFGCHNSIRLETKHFLNTLALTFISFSGRFVFAMQKHYLFFFASDPLVFLEIVLDTVLKQNMTLACNMLLAGRDNLLKDCSSKLVPKALANLHTGHFD